MNLIDPEMHGNAVLVFDRFFEIRRTVPDLDSLERIISAFAHIPYENLSKIIKCRNHRQDETRLRFPEEVMDDHIRHRLGGTCFSLTFLLHTILKHHAFSCYPVMADMRWGRGVHCALVCCLQSNTYLIDPGYLLTQPMAFNAGQNRMARTPYSGVEIIFDPDDGGFDLYTTNQTEKKWRYRFWNQPVPFDVFLEHWQASFRWNSMHGLCLTKVEKERLVYIHKTFYRETAFTGKRNRNIKHCVHQTVQDEFGIEGRWVEEAQAAIETNMKKERESGLWVPRHTARNGR